MAKRSFVCRCEDVTLDELEHARALGLERIEELKRYTGLGTGPCQGKECLATLARWMHSEAKAPKELLQPFTARPPLEPVSFAALASGPEPFEDDPANHPAAESQITEMAEPAQTQEPT